MVGGSSHEKEEALRFEYMNGNIKNLARIKRIPEEKFAYFTLLHPSEKRWFLDNLYRRSSRNPFIRVAQLFYDWL
jgi:hypothetical protein